MKATEILMNEHRVIERVLDALEIAAARLGSGQTVRPGFFLDAADFIRGFADGCHHSKEETVLFKEMVASGMPEDRGPIGVMLSEHEQGRRFTAGMRESAERLDGGDRSAVEAVVHNSQEFVALLRQHIAKEDGVLFPMASQMYPPQEQARLADTFAAIDQEDSRKEAHQRYLRVAEALSVEAAGLGRGEG